MPVDKKQDKTKQFGRNRGIPKTQWVLASTNNVIQKIYEFENDTLHGPGPGSVLTFSTLQPTLSSSMAPLKCFCYVSPIHFLQLGTK